MKLSIICSTLQSSLQQTGVSLLFFLLEEVIVGTGHHTEVKMMMRTFQLTLCRAHFSVIPHRFDHFCSSFSPERRMMRGRKCSRWPRFKSKSSSRRRLFDKFSNTLNKTVLPLCDHAKFHISFIVSHSLLAFLLQLSIFFKI